MLIKLLYILGIFLIVRLVINGLNSYAKLKEQVEEQNKKGQQNKNQEEDIIDAEFTVVNDDKNS
tara:strand:+ start:217 stop:408 length:192 start_codon:yes stop_codon:yes gene_type:complete